MSNNLVLIEKAANKLKALLNEVVFVGGSTLDLFITDQGAAPTRGTVDVAVLAEITTTRWLHCLLGSAAGRWGFSENTREAAPICRW